MPNVAAYRFVDLDDLPALRERLLGRASAAGPKGTVLPAPEGINPSLAPEPRAPRGWLDGLRKGARFAALPVKESRRAEAPRGRSCCSLNGGILRCLEENQGALHWRGECVVFDERESLTPSLA